MVMASNIIAHEEFGKLTSLFFARLLSRARTDGHGAESGASQSSRFVAVLSRGDLHHARRAAHRCRRRLSLQLQRTRCLPGNPTAGRDFAGVRLPGGARNAAVAQCFRRSNLLSELVLCRRKGRHAAESVEQPPRTTANFLRENWQTGLPQTHVAMLESGK